MFYQNDNTAKTCAQSLPANSPFGPHFQAIFDLPNFGVGILSSHFQWLKINHQLLKMLDDSEDALLAKPFVEIFPPDDRSHFQTLLSDYQLNGCQTLTIETCCLQANGQKIDVLLTLACSKGPDGENSPLVLLQDISERKQHERSLEIVAQISANLRKAATKTEMYPLILNEIVQILHTSGALIFSVDWVREEIHAEYGVLKLKSYSDWTFKLGMGITSRVIRSGQIYQTDEIHSDPDLLPNFPPPGDHAAICLPLTVQQSVIGVLWVTRSQPFNEADSYLLKAIADIAANAIHRSSLHEQTRNQLKRLNALRCIDMAITATHDLKTTLNILLEQVVNELGVDAADLLMAGQIGNIYQYAAGVGFQTHFIEHSRVRPGKGLAGQAILERKRVSIECLPKESDSSSRPMLLASEDFVSYHAVPLIISEEVKGVLEVFNRTPLRVSSEWLDFLEALAGQAAIAIESARLFTELQQSHIDLTGAYDATIEGWSRALELRDVETQGHSQRVTDLTTRLAEAMNISEFEIVHIRRGALLHDIGKMGIPDSILLKPGPLTEEEWQIMRRHPQLAYEMLSQIAFLRPALDIPLCHHEKWDGTGYPRHLQEEKIPLSARIFAIVDAWDALTSNRPYRPAWLPEKAKKYIEEQAGIHYDPAIVQIFFSLLERTSL